MKHSPLVIARRDVQEKRPPLFILFWCIFFTYTALPCAIIVHLWCWLFHRLVTPFFGIEPLYLRDYLVIDRHRLSRLNWIQKIGCVYCSYANAVTAFAKATANGVEVHACAIKHLSKRKGLEHQEDFWPYEEFK